MISLSHAERRQLEPLFLPTENTMILSYLEGHMGRGYWTGPESACGCIAIGDFRFFAGRSGGSRGRGAAGRRSFPPHRIPRPVGRELAAAHAAPLWETSAARHPLCLS